MVSLSRFIFHALLKNKESPMRILQSLLKFLICLGQGFSVTNTMDHMLLVSDTTIIVKLVVIN